MKKFTKNQSIKNITLCLFLSPALLIAAPNQTTNNVPQQVQTDTKVAYQQLLNLIKQNKLDEAKMQATKLIARDDKAIGAYLVLADIANKQKDLKEMERILLLGLQKAKGSEQAEVEVFKVLGQVYAATKQPSKILPLAEDISQRYPNNSLLINLLAQTQLLNNNKPAAEKALATQIAQNPKEVGNRLFLAKLLMEQADKTQDVIKLLDEAAALTPESPDALATKAAYFIKLKNNTEAMELAEKIDKQFPTLIVGKLLKADVYLSEQKRDEAIEVYRQIYKMQPSDRVLLALVDLMLAQKQQSEAIALLEQEAAKNPKSLAIHLKVANLYIQKNDLKLAEQHYQAMLAIEADNVIALNNLAILYAKNKNPQAITLAKKAYLKVPNEPAIADTYGYILVKQGDAKEGLAVLEKAAAAVPKAGDLQFHLAEAYAKTGNKKKAIEVLEGLAKLEQNFSEKESATNLLNELKK
jgi:putative PEP-CTERM system TPR-repeat lipoprotein